MTLAPSERLNLGVELQLLSDSAVASQVSGRRLYDALERLRHAGLLFATRAKAGREADPAPVLRAAGAVRALLDQLNEHVGGVEDALDGLHFPSRAETARMLGGATPALAAVSRQVRDVMERSGILEDGHPESRLIDTALTDRLYQ